MQDGTRIQCSFLQFWVPYDIRYAWRGLRGQYGNEGRGRPILVSTLPRGPGQQGRVDPWAPSQKYQLRDLALSGSSLAAPSQAVNLPRQVLGLGLLVQTTRPPILEGLRPQDVITQPSYTAKAIWAHLGLWCGGQRHPGL